MKTSFRASLRNLTHKFTSLAGVSAIRRGLVSIIPVLLIGAFSLMIRYIPINAYRHFLETFAGGLIDRFLNAVYSVTFGLLSVYMCVSVSHHYALLRSDRGRSATIGCPIASLAVFIIFTGVDHLSVDTLGPKGMFICLISTLLGSSIFCFLLSYGRKGRLLADGADVNLNNALRMLLPLAVTVVIAVLLNELILLLSGGANLHDLVLRGMNALFSLTGDGFLSGLLFVLLSSILWFFGIHGSDVLEGVSEKLFIPNVQINADLVAAGEAPTEILTKQFFDLFVLMGGCGSAMCLLIALLIFGKRRSNRGLAKMAAFPMIFNINEIMVFGLPIIYNPVMLIPFLLVPVVCFLTSYFAMSMGWVPMVATQVEWTMPVLFGGYLGTGSVAGSLLQLFNLGLGVLIYWPFVKRYDQERLESAKEEYEHLVTMCKDAEQSREPITLTHLSGPDGAFAKALAADLAHAVDHDGLKLHYQPQYNAAGQCVGAEALLRFELPGIGMIYPPMLIKIAEETDLLPRLETAVLRRAVADAEHLWRETEVPMKISVNLSGRAIQSRETEELLLSLAADDRACGSGNRICIEVTEQTAVDFNDELKARISRLREAGYLFAIDDFSAGSTSLQYLQENCFDLVKLDGSIVQNCTTNPRSQEIIALIVELSHTLDFEVLAEYVSTGEIRDCMERAGCYLYQGWYFAAAMPFEELIHTVRKNNE